MKPQFALLLLLCVAQFAFAEPKSTASNEDKKPDRSPEGFEAAEKDIKALKITLKKKSPEQLVKSFITSEELRDGYHYYYSDMANHAVRDELASRGKSAEAALQANRSNRTLVRQAINGRPNYTIGKICSDLLDQLQKQP